MKLVLELTAEEQARLRHKAERFGLDDAAFLRMVINDTPAAELAARSLAEMLDGRIGVVDSSDAMGGAPSRLSEDRAAYGAHLERKRTEGRL